MINRFVALGDSLTEGVGDPVGRSLRGWADLLAGAIQSLNPALEYHNLALRSLKTAEVVRDQLPRALKLKPDLAGAVVGMNDLQSTDFDPDAYRRDLAALVGPLTEIGALVLTGTFAGDLPMLRVVPPATRARIRRNLAAASDVVREVSADYEAVLLDAPEGWRYSMAECSIDGCHPNAAGHAHIAQLAADALAELTGHSPLVVSPSTTWMASSLRHLQWLVTGRVPRSGASSAPASANGGRASSTSSEGPTT